MDTEQPLDGRDPRIAAAREAATTTTESVVHTDTSCLSLMDNATRAAVWQDILFDGSGHSHGAGGMMLNAAALSTHLDHDGNFPVRLYTSESGCVGFDLDLDPYGPDLDSLRALAGDPVVLPPAADHDHSHDHAHPHNHAHPHDHSHGSEYGHSHDHGPLRDGWSAPVLVPLTSATAILGDPAGIPEADNTGGLLPLTWPAPGGALVGTVYTRGGIRRALSVAWLPAGTY